MSVKILIVDDNPGELRFLRQFFLRRFSLPGVAISVCDASDGEEALAVYAKEQPQLVVVDLLLPKIDGLGVCRHIRASEGGDAVALLAISGMYRDDAVVTRVREEFGGEFLAKPLELDELKRVSTALLTEKNAMSTTHEDVPGAKNEAISSLNQPSVPDQIDQGAFVLDQRIQGPLKWGTLAQLLIVAADTGTTGTLTVSRGRVRKVIYVVEGRPVFVDSNVRNETLGAYLLAKQFINEDQLASAMRMARAENKKLGESLVKMRVLDQDTIEHGLQAQARLKLVTALRWSHGAYAFAPGGEFVSRVPDCPVDVIPLVLAAMDRFCRADDIADQIDTSPGTVVTLTEVGMRHRSKLGQGIGKDILQMLERDVSHVSRMLEQSADAAALLSRMAAFQVCGFASIAQKSPQEMTARPSVDARFRHEHRPSVELAHLDPLRVDATNQTPSGLDDAFSLMPEGTLIPGKKKGGAVGRVSTSEIVEAPALSVRLDEAEVQWLERVAASGEQLTHYELLQVAADAATEDIELARDRQLERCERLIASGALSSTQREAVAYTCERVRLGASILSDPQRRAEYDAEIHATQWLQTPGRKDSFSAELLFQEGRKLLEEQSYSAAVQAFQRAAEMNPEQPDYYASLGWAVFLDRGRGEAGAAAARAHIDAALQLSPDSPQVHEVASEIELDNENFSKAAEHLSQAVKYGPVRLDLFGRLRDVLYTQAKYADLERLYRNVIFRMREREPERTAPLWVDLARLYLQKLGQRKNAELALQVAERLAPEYEGLRELKQRLEAVPQESFEELVDAARKRFAAHPEKDEALHDLFALYQRSSHWQEVTSVGAVLASRGTATSEQRALMERLREQMPVVPSGRVESTTLDDLRDKTDLVSLETILAEASPVLSEALPVPLEALGSDESCKTALESLPTEVSETLGAVARRMGVIIPPIYLSNSTIGVVPRPAEEAALVISRSLINEKNLRLIAFLTARALSCLPLGRRHVFGRSPTELKWMLLAAVSAFRTEMPFTDPSGRVVVLRERLLADVERVKRMGRQFEKLFESGSQLNLSEWIRGVKRTSARVALAVCGDPQTALEQVQAEPTTVESLISFVLDPTFVNFVCLE